MGNMEKRTMICKYKDINGVKSMTKDELIKHVISWIDFELHLIDTNIRQNRSLNNLKNFLKSEHKDRTKKN